MWKKQSDEELDTWIWALVTTNVAEIMQVGCATLMKVIVIPTMNA
jgi:hypothetical protein